MRVLVDALICKPGQGGLFSYSAGLVAGLSRQPGVQLSVAASVPEVADGLDGIEMIGAPRRTRDFIARATWREANARRLCAEAEADVLLSTSPELPLRPLPIPSAMIVHDVGPLVAPALYGRVRRARFSLLLGRACARSTAILCVSTLTALDLHRWGGISPDRIHVIGGAAQPILDEPTRSPASVGNHFLLVGSIYANKNTGTAVRAYGMARRRAHAEGRRCPGLVLVGPAAASDLQRLRRDADAAGVEDAMEHRGFVDGAELADLYDNAVAVLFPSLYEGLGLPVLEAMRRKAPIIASDLPSVRESSRGAVTLVSNPLSSEEWRDHLLAAIHGELRDPREIEAARAIALGRTWDGVAESCVRVLRSVAAGVRFKDGAPWSTAGGGEVSPRPMTAPPSEPTGMARPEDAP